MSSPDLPFERLEGQDQLSAIHNRANATKRIEFLTGVDLKSKPLEYKLLIDAELYERFYKDEPASSLIDEIWCQRAAQIIKELEAKDKEEIKSSSEAIKERVEQLYKEAQVKPAIPPVKVFETPKKISLFGKFLKAVKGQYVREKQTI